MKIRILVTSIAIASLVFGYLVTKSNNQKDQNIQTTGVNQSSAISDPAIIELESTGTRAIQDYSQSALKNSKSEHNVIFFHAKWSTICTKVKQNIDSESIPDSLSIFLVDYDSGLGKQLENKYKIPNEYTMVQVDKNGNEITQWVATAGYGVDEIIKNLELN